MSVKITDGFAPGDDEKVISILSKWTGGYLSDRLFIKLAGITPQAGIVVIIFRQNQKGEIEVLLVPRPDNDPLWPEMLNLPGKMFRAADYNRKDDLPVNGPLERIQKDELKIKFSKEPEFVGVSLHKDDRGPLVVLVYLSEVDNNLELPKGRMWCSINNLEKVNNLVQTELIPINIALNYYQNKLKT